MAYKTLLLACMLLAASVHAEDSDIVDLASSTPDLSTLVSALKAGDLVSTLQQTGPFTVFAPTNEAFAALPKYYLDFLLQPQHKAILQKVLTFHVVSGTAAFSTDLSDNEKVKTVEGRDVVVHIGSQSGNVYINDAQVLTADVSAKNGVVHIINRVLIPPFFEEFLSGAEADKNIVDIAVATSDLSTLVAALKAGDLVSTLEGKGPFTVFAPTNEAFAALPKHILDFLLQPEHKALLQKVLTYHVVSGTAAKSTDLSDEEKVKTVEGRDVIVHLSQQYGVFINNAKVTTADVLASNGVVHIIDHVLIPPFFAFEALMLSSGKNIVDLAVATPDLSTLVAALKAGDLVSTLEGDGPFTVFAPTNEAFAALPTGTLEFLLKPENKAKLQQILSYHVVAGVAAKSTDLQNGEKIKTVEGLEVKVSLSSRGVFIDNAKVLTADVEATNGVVHIVDHVLIPADFAPKDSKMLRGSFLDIFSRSK